MPEVGDSRDLHLVGDEGPAFRWMSYAELGSVRGINIASAKRLTVRRKWRRQAGNDGTTRVAVPIHEATPWNGKTPATDDDVALLVSSLEAALSALREQLDRERTRADEVAEAAKQLAARLAETESQVMELRASAEMAGLVRGSLERALRAEEVINAEAQAALMAERAARSMAEADASAFRQAEQARRKLGHLARLRQAWRGE
ncbi:MAG TPA: hypothetical protein VL614_31210 [Acetobacteraceae bacterium]|jgi:hypothetical protein|nr:hypothetical protein [Acetobacteraceae bacterium]